MNLTVQLPSLPIATVINPATETLRRENIQREVITKPAATNQSAAEKGVASEKERGKSPAQNNEQIDFADIRKRAEQENTTVNDSTSKEEQSSSRNGQQESNTEPDPAEVYAEEKQILSLQQRDQEVRSHERAHSAVGGVATGAPSYSFEVGPDGKKYAVNGEVSVDLSQVSGNPRATISKMQKVHAAALAPVNPSAQDHRVASSATGIIAQSQSDLQAINNDEIIKSSNSFSQIKSKDVFAKDDDSSSNDSDDFDRFINQTLSAQDEVTSTRSNDVSQRASRIESFYLEINQAYEKPPRYQFELTA